MINLSRALGLAEARKLELEHVTVHSSERVVLFYQRRASRAGTPACKGDRSERLAAAILFWLPSVSRGSGEVCSTVIPGGSGK